MTLDASTPTAVRTPVDQDRLGCTDCERIRDGRIAQPVNALTSLAFVAAAGIVAARHRHAAHRQQALGYCATLTLVGMGSAAFHGPQPPGAKAMHDWPIAALAALTIGTPVVRRLRGATALPGWRRGRGWALAGVSAAAILSYAGGRTSARTCRPDSPLQLHGLWHVLTATGFTLAADLLYDDSRQG